jgi:hypothetical protein
MKLPKKLVQALANGWRNIDAYSLFDDEGKLAHAEATIKALRKAGYKITKKEQR